MTTYPPLTDDYVSQAVRDARRFQGTWDQGTSGTLAAHTFRLARERKTLMNTIESLEVRNREMRAQIEARQAKAAAATAPSLDTINRRLAEAGLPEDVPAEFRETVKNFRFTPAEPAERPEWKPMMVGSTIPPDQMEAAWSGIKARAEATRRAITGEAPPEPIEVQEYLPQTPTRVIGISGRKGSGKNAAAACIPGAVVVQLADPLYAMLSAMLGIDEVIIRGREFKERPLPVIGKSVRQLLQTLGTEWGREMVCDDVWLRLIEQRIERLRASGVTVIAVADVRFENEAAFIRDLPGGEVWHVTRPDAATGDDHASESGIEMGIRDYQIFNTGTLDELRELVLYGFTRAVCG